MATRIFDSLNDIMPSKNMWNLKVRVMQLWTPSFNTYQDINFIEMVLVDLSVSFTIFKFTININYCIDFLTYLLI